VLELDRSGNVDLYGDEIGCFRPPIDAHEHLERGQRQGGGRVDDSDASLVPSSRAVQAAFSDQRRELARGPRQPPDPH
jgi:hypothetical protein